MLTVLRSEILLNDTVSTTLINKIYRNTTMTNQEYKEQGYVCLYIFTHNITGLKYFGKTINSFDEMSLLNYGGSGVYWKKHIKKHGKDLSVEIYGIHHISKVKDIAVKFSEDNNIVNALNESGNRKGRKIWANSEYETGLSYIQKGHKWSKNAINKRTESRKGTPFSLEAIQNFIKGRQKIDESGITAATRSGITLSENLSETVLVKGELIKKSVIKIIKE